MATYSRYYNSKTFAFLWDQNRVMKVTGIMEEVCRDVFALVAEIAF